MKRSPGKRKRRRTESETGRNIEFRRFRGSMDEIVVGLIRKAHGLGGEVLVELLTGDPDDVFVAQGFNAARDRLWQLDLWRRRGEGKLAEAFGCKGICVKDPADLDDAILEMLAYDGPVIFDCLVEKHENCFPMIPSGEPHNKMILGENVDTSTAIKAGGAVLV